MFYRLHRNNDSKFIENEDRVALREYLNKYKLLTKNTAIDFDMIINYEKLTFHQIKTHLFYYYATMYLIFNVINLRIHKIIFARIKKNVFDL
jgi:hypothetical protein